MRHPLKFVLSAALALAAACFHPQAYAMPPKPFTTHSFADIRARHAGVPLVVHIWAMSCGPCLAELPKWGAFAKKRPGVALVLVRFDQAPAEASEARLARSGLEAVESWGVAGEADEYLRASVDRKWIGDVPRTMLIAPDGEVTSIRGTADLSSVEQWVDEVKAGRPARRH
ncbi:MAG: hypothetical protein KGQ57_01275 [Burkholderiales bacterium]|nr:hypothetical protein [Burkholderiales bacterium]